MSPPDTLPVDEFTAGAVNSDWTAATAAAPLVNISTASSSSTIQLVNIRQHVPLTLDLQHSNYMQWSTFFLIVFRKFGLTNHVSVDSKGHHDVEERVQIDTTIISWVYTTISAKILDIIIQPNDTAYAIWHKVEDLFQDNEMTRHYNRINLPCRPISTDYDRTRTDEVSVPIHNFSRSINDRAGLNRH
ncbi:uncharacterized protein LOC133927982 [Phragmites australis]|uniref:uncharacterized protein LOC133927982 n=1 Tax=Phragmites australis TaxID=29695 RepID=UPI002D789863|nr:uncharacterized protein LOC133927982 [Phragmites australis]